MAVQLFSYDDIMQWDDPEWLVDGFLQRGTTNMLGAPSKVGKTLFALRLAAAVSTGSDFFGRPTKRGRVVYFYAEKAHTTLKGRLRALSTHGVAMDHGNLRFIKDPIDITNTANLTELAKEIGACDLIVIDTLTNSIGNEGLQDHDAMRRFVQNAKGLGELTNSTVLFIHHDHKQSFTEYGKPIPTGFYGPSVLLNLVDSYTAMYPYKGVVRVETRKSNGSEDFNIVGKIESVVVSESPLWTSGVFEQTSEPEESKSDAVQKKQGAKVKNKDRATVRAFMLGKEAVSTDDLAGLFNCTKPNVGRKMKPFLIAHEVTVTTVNRSNVYTWIAG